MKENILLLLVAVAPVLFLITYAVSIRKKGGGLEAVKKWSLVSAVFTILIAALSGFFVAGYGLLQSSTIGYAGLGLAIRLDSLSVLMLCMIALLGFIVIRFSHNYMDGDPRQNLFIGRLAATIASVQLLVISANLGLLFTSWVMTSYFLHHLLVFYPDRPRAQMAARKKFIMARMGDASLLGAVLLLYTHFGTGDLETIFQHFRTNSESVVNFAGMEGAGILLALAACFKSAQFPTHGWLVEVMETPTPVSALLHAGLLNAGPFLITRMSFIFTSTSYAPVMLILIGGFTGLFASVVFLTQPSVKTALGYSSVAHMGFMLMVCGLGVYPAAMLHLVAHSFYKAHAFLSSGSVVELVRASKVSLPKRLGSPVRLAGSILLAMLIYLSVAWLWGIDPGEEFALLATGAIIIMGLSQMLAPAVDVQGTIKGVLSTLILASMVALAFFSLEGSTHYLLQDQLPALRQPDFYTKLIISMVLLTYGAAVLLQMLQPIIPASQFWYRMGIHFRNGWYANALLDRLIGALKFSPIKIDRPLLAEIPESNRVTAARENKHEEVAVLDSH